MTLALTVLSPRTIGMEVAHLRAEAFRKEAARRLTATSGRAEVERLVAAVIKRMPNSYADDLRTRLFALGVIENTDDEDVDEAMRLADEGFREYAAAVSRAEAGQITPAALRKMLQLARDGDKGMTTASLRVPKAMTAAFQALAAQVRGRDHATVLLACATDAFDVLTARQRVLLAFRMVPADLDETRLLTACWGAEGAREEALEDALRRAGHGDTVTAGLDRLVARRLPVIRADAEGDLHDTLFQRLEEDAPSGDGTEVRWRLTELGRAAATATETPWTD